MDPHGFNKGRSLKFCVGSRVRQTPEEGWRAYWLKHCGNNKDEDNSLKTLNDKNHQALSQKSRQVNLLLKIYHFMLSVSYFGFVYCRQDFIHSLYHLGIGCTKT